MKKKSKLLNTMLAATVLGAAAWLCWPPFEADADPVDELKQRQAKVVKVAAEALDSVVALTNRGGLGAGSGVIVSEDGLIMTASHVTDELGDEFTVTLHDGREVKARSIGAHRTFDAALAQITTEGTYPFMPLAKDAQVGEWCIAMGHPGGPEPNRTPPVRLGKIWKQGAKSKFLTTDCTLSGGDSGGPLFNLDGEIIGIHSSISPNTNYNRHVPISAFHESWEEMKSGKRWGRLGTAALLDDDLHRIPFQIPGQGANLGVQLTGSEPVIRAVVPLSAADAAGMRPGDRIVEIDGAEVDTTTTLQRLVWARKPGDDVKIKIVRKEKEMILDVTLGGKS